MYILDWTMGICNAMRCYMYHSNLTFYFRMCIFIFCKRFFLYFGCKFKSCSRNEFQALESRSILNIIYEANTNYLCAIQKAGLANFETTTIKQKYEKYTRV